MKNRQSSAVPALLIGVFCGIVLFWMIFLILAAFRRPGGAALSQQKPVPAPKTVILDAGHGGFDGGASAPDGKPEAELNLQFCRTLKPLLESCGFRVLLTRADSGSLEADPTRPIRERKRSDMHTRLAIMEEHPDAVFLSIHQNSSPYRSAHGSVVYYAPRHPGSRLLAAALQKELIQTLQPDNRRTPVEAKSNLFLLFRAEIPAVLVECGFLSNPEEYARLQNPGYQKALCLLIAKTLTENWNQITAAPGAV